jgi:hypothetical protein
MLLCYWNVVRNVRNARLHRMVNVLGMYFVPVAAAYGLRHLAARSAVILPAMTGAWLPVGAGFAVLRDEE